MDPSGFPNYVLFARHPSATGEIHQSTAPAERSQYPTNQTPVPWQLPAEQAEGSALSATHFEHDMNADSLAPSFSTWRNENSHSPVFPMAVPLETPSRPQEVGSAENVVPAASLAGNEGQAN